MSSPSLPLQSLLSRPSAFRWLWVHHDEIASLREAGGSSRIWSELSRIRRSGGHADNRSSLRDTWRKVDAVWATASPELRAADVYPEDLGGTKISSGE